MSRLARWIGEGEEKTDALAVAPTAQVAKAEADDIVVYHGSGRRGDLVQFRSRSLKIAGKTYDVDPRQLIRMIKQVTQTIGEYKERENPYSGYVIGALRKARADMVSDLETHFHIHWEIDESTGKSRFYM